jgi:hypothetical protein
VITVAKFIQTTGREPENDDMERVNCAVAGSVGHFFCGWDHRADRPVFETGGRHICGELEDGA